MILSAAKHSSCCDFGDLGFSKTKTDIVLFFIRFQQLSSFYILCNKIFLQNTSVRIQAVFSCCLYERKEHIKFRTFAVTLILN